MIPYFEQPSWSIGPITIHAFGLIVAAGVLVGLTIGARRFRHLGLDERTGESLGWYVIVAGFLGAHVFAVLFYFPQRILETPLVLLKVWEPLSSFGGVLGAMIGGWLFFRLRGREVDPSQRWAYMDVAAFVFPVSLAIGRLGCAVAHDHPGTITTFPLGISLASDAARTYVAGVYAIAGRIGEVPPFEAFRRLGFHDLGLYEFLYLTVVVVPVTLMLGRRKRAPGTFVLSFIALYMPVRFALDFLRVGDARYGGLTPAQWTALLLIGVLPFLWRRRRFAGGASLGVVLIPMGAALACSNLAP